MNGAPRSRVLVIIGSVRVGRRSPQIAKWVCEVVERSAGLTCEIVDLKDWSLPADDEPGIPSNGVYSQPHTRAWSAKVTAAHGVVIVSPQYNWGYPAPLKNALDHLYREWSGKPLMIVTFGGHGGSKCAEQLRQVAEGLKMRPIATMPAISLSHEAIKNELPLTEEELDAHAACVTKAAMELEAMLALSN